MLTWTEANRFGSIFERVSPMAKNRFSIVQRAIASELKAMKTRRLAIKWAVMALKPVWAVGNAVYYRSRRFVVLDVVAEEGFPRSYLLRGEDGGRYGFAPGYGAPSAI